MMLELLVAGLCATGSNCNSAAKAYYASKPSAQFYVKSKKKAVQKSVGRFAYVSAPALVGFAVGKVPQIRMSRHFSCGGNKDTVLCLYNLSF